MQIGSIARLWSREARTFEGDLFSVSVSGRGRDVVFIHGLTASPDSWEGVAARFGTEMRAHFIHIRGFAGLAPSPSRRPADFLKPLADELATYIRTHIKGPAAVAGHSMGGLVALILTRDAPRLVDRLMVVDVPAFFSVLINPFLTSSSAAGLADAARRRYVENDAAAFEEGVWRASEKLVRSPAMVERIAQWGLTSDRQTTADIMAEVMVTDLRPDLKLITRPVEVVYAWDKAGHSSRVVLDQTYASAYANLADCRKLRIDDARHYIMLDQPDEFYRAMRAWLMR
ncbi:MAG: alpha/beta hydrolase [Alphaproteobacteria bacterium]|nr:alpha/beta hydrolase [Alphaproteobacteria bacterium]